MSKANDQLLQQLQQYLLSNLASAQSAAQTEPKYLTDIGNQANTFMNELGAKNYSTGFTPSDFWSMDSLADRTKQRDQIMGAAPTGDAALAGGQKTPFAELDKQNRNDEFNADYGREFQSNVASSAQNAKAAQMQLGNLDQNRKLGAASDITGLLGSAFAGENYKPVPTWQKLVTGGVAAIPAVLNAISGNSNFDSNGGRSEGVGAGSGGFGSYTGYNNQVYNLPGYGGQLGTGGQSPFSSVQTYASQNPGFQNQFRPPTFSWR